MRKHYIDIAGKWAFVFAYNIGERDLDEVGEWLEALGASDKEVEKAKYLLTLKNKGVTLSRSGLRMSVMCIGKATDLAQWWDTVAHEMDHLQRSIMRYYDVREGSEEAAYLQGYIMRKIIKVLRNGRTY